VSVYVAEHARGRGLGRALLEELQRNATELGYWKLVGKLFTANAASAGMVRSCGWREVGMHHKHSRLDGEWRDVLLVERVL
jgi:L-amino acid N-acyltransferase YncA